MCATYFPTLNYARNTGSRAAVPGRTPDATTRYATTSRITSFTALYLARGGRVSRAALFITTVVTVVTKVKGRRLGATLS